MNYSEKLTSGRGILTIFQIEGTQKDPVTRYMAFWSLISALLSLLYGCIFIIRFSGMRRVYQATEWAIVSFVCPLGQCSSESDFVGSSAKSGLVLECMDHASNAGGLASMVSTYDYT